MTKIKLKHTITLEVDSDDYEVHPTKRKRMDCAWCPLVKSPNNHTREILEANHRTCWDVYEELFGCDCTQSVIKRKQ